MDRQSHETTDKSIIWPMETVMTKRSRVDLSGPVVYENGAVKRVMFDGGDATFADAGKGASVQPCKFGGKPHSFLNQILFAQRVYITQKPNKTMNISTNIR